MKLRLSLYQLSFLFTLVLMLLGSLRHCEQKQNIVYLQGLAKESEAKRATQARGHTQQILFLRSQNDSLLACSRWQRSSNQALMLSARSLDSMLRLQVDSTRRIKQEADYLRKQDQVHSKYVQQMFWVLHNGQEDLRAVVDSVRSESKSLADRYYCLSEKLADSSRFAQKTISIYKDSILLKPVSELASLEPGHKKRKSGGINPRRRQREQARKIKKRRRNTLLRG